MNQPAKTTSECRMLKAEGTTTVSINLKHLLNCLWINNFLYAPKASVVWANTLCRMAQGDTQCGIKKTSSLTAKHIKSFLEKVRREEKRWWCSGSAIIGHNTPSKRERATFWAQSDITTSRCPRLLCFCWRQDSLVIFQLKKKTYLTPWWHTERGTGNRNRGLLVESNLAD